MCGEFAANAGDKAGQAFQILGATELSANFGVFLGAQAAFIFGTQKYQIDIAGRRVDRAPSQRHRRDTGQRGTNSAFVDACDADYPRYPHFAGEPFSKAIN